MNNTDGRSIIRFEKSDNLPENSIGIRFMNGGKLIERKNSCWSGTPPISYVNFSGDWQMMKNGDIVIDVSYWGGMEHKVWKIIDVTRNFLKVEVVSREDEMKGAAVEMMVNEVAINISKDLVNVFVGLDHKRSVYHYKLDFIFDKQLKINKKYKLLLIDTDNDDRIVLSEDIILK